MTTPWAVGLEDVIKLLLACVIGGAIGVERELSHKTAGLRTIIMICVGSTLFTIFSLRLGAPNSPDRIAAGIVTGIGFLGAGVIMRQGLEIRGITTASTIWVAAALGMGIGGGFWLYTCIATGAVLVVLAALPRLERRLGGPKGKQEYTIVCPVGADRIARLQNLFRQHGLDADLQSRAKHGDKMTCVWEVVGPADAHDKAISALMADPEVEELEF